MLERSSIAEAKPLRLRGHIQQQPIASHTFGVSWGAAITSGLVPVNGMVQA
jgi:hypothetical protein